MKAAFLYLIKVKEKLYEILVYLKERNNFFSVKIYISLVDMIPADRTTNEYPVSVKLFKPQGFFLFIS